MRPIDADALIKDLDGIRDTALGVAFLAVIEAAPTVELIRCGECKHNYVDGDNVRFNVCELMHNKVQSDDWYCADAERRSDE